jgi:serine protease AprX
MAAGLPICDLDEGVSPMSRYTVEGFRDTVPTKQISKWALAVALGATLAGAIPAPGSYAADLHGKADLFVTQQAGKDSQTGWTSVIVQLDGGLTAANQAQLSRLGADIYRRLDLENAVAVRIPTRSLPKLAALPCVTRLSADAPVHKTDEFTVGNSGAGVAFSQYGLTGSGLAVAVVDSGIRSHVDLNDKVTGSRIVAAVNFSSTDPGKNDNCGHGTHVAGIIAGNGASSTGPHYFRTFFGIARSANLVSVKVLDDKGQGNVSDVIAGINWAIANASAYNIKVINLSLGHPVGESYTTDPLCQAVESAWKAGIVVVCAAGNEGRVSDTASGYCDNEGYGTNYGSIQAPGNDPYVITVGAMKSVNSNRMYDRIATYSSRGPSRLDLVLKPDIVAPGNRVISTVANTSYLDQFFGATNDVPLSAYSRQTTNQNTSAKYMVLSGTSMAAPVVAGAAALLLQKDPTLSPDTIKARLMISADKWGFNGWYGDPCTFGAGYLNIPAALNCQAVASAYALSPCVYQDDWGFAYIDMSSISGERAIWGTGVNDLRAIWGTRAVWGTSAISSSLSLWGDSVWSDKAIWGHSSGAVDLSSRVINGE